MLTYFCHMAYHHCPLLRLLYRFYTLMLEHLDLKDRVKSLESQLKASGLNSVGGAGALGGVPAPKPQEPSAPPAHEEPQGIPKGKSKAA